MKKKILIPIIAALALLALLFIPIPSGRYDDGGTRTYTSLTYKIVDWNKLNVDGVFDETRLYFGADRRKSLDELYAMEEPNIINLMRATVTDVNGTTVFVTPLETEWELSVSDRIMFSSAKLDDIGVEVGTVLDISYKGGIMESYPAQIDVVFWERSTMLHHMDYPGEWIDKSTTPKYEKPLFSDIIITEIYADCFFASPVIPMPYQIKLNGVLGEEWCVGDQVICKYENVYFDESTYRIECDFLSVDASNFEVDPAACYKPVIYLYPETSTEVSVSLELNGELTCTYPAYNDGWTVIAEPDGSLTDKDGQSYNYLYWEGDVYTNYDLTKGFCVKGEDTAEFLEYALEKLGLTRREANEFIVFWLPLMQNNPYNVITFAEKEYTDVAHLEVSPEPDTLIRVFMVWQASESFVELEPQELLAPERDGFTVVEWGGTEIKQ